MARSATTPEPIRNRDAITDHIVDVMHDEGFRDLSIDNLLSHPFFAIAMALRVAIRSGTVTAATAKRIAGELTAMVKREPKAVEAINEVLRIALRSRKAGDLRQDRY